jgi:NADH-quinone oxidoreductase subunit F
MSNIISLEERKKRWTDAQTYGTRIVICAGTGCVAGGALKIYDKFREVLKSKGMSVVVALEKEKADFGLAETGCKGFCQMGPLVTIKPLGVMYVKVAEGDVDEIVEKTLKTGEVVQRLLYKCPHDSKQIEKQDDIPFYKSQVRLMLDMCGSIDVNDVDEYVAGDGYFMARKAVLQMSGKEICDEILASGLRGRGGGGFPTGRKWEFARVNQSDVKYVICNGDEGDPGAFMDRCIMEGNPHAVLEGMIVTGAAIGASEGIIYVRMEYPLAVRRLRAAIKQAREAGFLGKNIFGSKFNFDVEIMEGAGAFVCGEETALMASVEGRRGMPILKPPFPAEKGLFGKPTIINNVETLAAVPVIMRMGATEYSKLGTEKSKGTKVFALTGHIANSGLIEVPFGMTLRKIVGEIGGGVIDDDGNHIGALDYKAVQIGGPSGGCLTQKHLDMPIDYEGLIQAGAMVGSGGLVVMNQKTCIVKIAQYFMQFTQNESCGKCTPCREGTRQMLELLKKITDGKAEMQDLELLEELAKTVMVSSLCMLGKTAPNPVISTLEHFRDEYLAHVVEKRCPVNACEALMKYKILPDMCKGCTLCIKQCPVDAITGERGKGDSFKICLDKCIKCDACVGACKFKAIVRG